VIDAAATLLALAAHPNHCSRAWVWEQYDHQVGADTVRKPGADAAVVRVHGTPKALAFTSDVTPRYCVANPQQGGRQAVAEAFRNLCATGALPLATTDNLNFGNPEKPLIMGQLVGCLKGIAEACIALDMPIVSGNVSLYNETDGTGILPTPTIGAVGLMTSLDQLIPTGGEAGDALVLLGTTEGHLGRSAMLADLHGIEAGDAPHVDLAAERAAGDLVRALKAAGLLRAAHDLSDGGLAMAALEMAMASGCGADIDGSATLTAAEWFFGEDQARYLLAIAQGDVDAALAAAAAAGGPAARIGALGGDAVTLGGAATPLAALSAAHKGGFAAMMGEG
jgi:phosphoribosylformylglycinamidine (FGAM) synthase-like enzyme